MHRFHCGKLKNVSKPPWLPCLTAVVADVGFATPQIGPASMSGRAQMLATSPEAAHAAAHAAAMQSMAAGYSASESIAAAYGLPSNTPSHITLPLLQQFQVPAHPAPPSFFPLPLPLANVMPWDEILS